MCKNFDINCNNHVISSCAIDPIIFGTMNPSILKNYCNWLYICVTYNCDFLLFKLGSAVIPIRFHADKEGQYECHIQLKSGHDMRIIVIESTVLAEGKLAQIEFKTQAIQPLTQNIPVVSI